MCTAQTRISKIDGSIVERDKHDNICAQNIINGKPLKDVTNVDFT